MFPRDAKNKLNMYISNYNKDLAVNNDNLINYPMSFRQSVYHDPANYRFRNNILKIKINN